MVRVYISAKMTEKIDEQLRKSQTPLHGRLVQLVRVWQSTVEHVAEQVCR